MESYFDKLSPFIKEYVFSSSWKGLRPVQEEAIRVIFDTKDNLLLSCGTSSGKTEAAFFPILTQIEKNTKEGISVLYIAPLKALINDQFERISYVCRNSGIALHHRHGDVSIKSRKSLNVDSTGILQITPESLESLFLHHPCDIETLFKNLSFVVIDELHSFLGNDRGGQVFCLVSRLIKKAGCMPRIVALSATIGNTDSACELISACNGRKTVCPKFLGEKLEVSLLYECFDDIKKRDEYIYDAVKKKNSLVFSNSRDETEKITASLRNISEKRGDNGDVFIHHASISASLRKDAEKALKSSQRHAVVCATSSLELGIDIGRLERVVSLGTPNSVSSFLQRLGRSGRRENIPEMLSVFLREKDDRDKYNILPFELLQGIAIVELYRRERFVETGKGRKYPFSLLCHQTLSVLASYPEGLDAANLARIVLTLPPFSDITTDDYKFLLSHLAASGYIQKTGDGKIITGISAEKLLCSYRFYSVFKEEESFTVKDEAGNEIGKIPENVTVGGKFSLAGRVWICERVESETKTIYARAVKGRLTSFWHGSLAGIDDKIISFTAKILSENEIYPYLGKNAAKMLIKAREFAKENSLLDYPIHKVAEDEYIILPWLGSRGMNTLCRYIRFFTGGELTSKTVIENPYVLSLHLREKDEEKFISVLREHRFSENSKCSILISENESCITEKYDYLVPKELLLKAYAEDKTDAAALSDFIEKL